MLQSQYIAKQKRQENKETSRIFLWMDVQVLITFAARLHESRDEFRPEMIKFSFDMSVFILGSRDESRPARVEFISPMSHKHCSRIGTFIPGLRLPDMFRHVSPRDDISPRFLEQG